MATEQKAVFYDLEKMQQIALKLAQIDSDKALSESMKTTLLTKLMDSLPDEDKREFHHYMRTVQNESDPLPERILCTDDTKGKIALIEFTNIQYSYCQTTAFVAMISYLLHRVNSYDGDKEEVKKFCRSIFGNDNDRYMGTVYDLFYKNNKAKHADFIPEFDVNILEDCVPSIDQWTNFLKYADAKFPELRALVSGMFGIRPSQDAIIHVHGVFNSATDPALTNYRNANMDKISSLAELIPVPIGTTWLLDKYKQFVSGTVLYNPSEPDLEILHTNRQTVEMNSNAMFNKRVKKLKNRMTGEDIARIKNYRSEIESFRKNDTGVVPEVKQNIDVLKKKIDEIHEKYTNENEVITNVIKVTPGKNVTMTTCAAEATD